MSATPERGERKPRELAVIEVLADGSMKTMTAKETREWRASTKTNIRDKTGEPKRKRSRP